MICIEQQGVRTEPDRLEAVGVVDVDVITDNCQ